MTKVCHRGGREGCDFWSDLLFARPLSEPIELIDLDLADFMVLIFNRCGLCALLRKS